MNAREPYDGQRRRHERAVEYRPGPRAARFPEPQPAPPEAFDLVGRLLIGLALVFGLALVAIAAIRFFDPAFLRP